MKKVLLLSAAIFALSAPAAFAQINLAYNDCGAFGTSNINFACASNAGAAVMVSSAIPPADVPNFVGAELVLDLQVDDAALPDWFHLEAGGCRAGRLIASFDFTTGPFSCNDPWAGAAFGGLQYFPAFEGDAARGRIKTAAAVAVGVPLAGGFEWYMAKTTMLFSNTVAPNVVCAGCATPACIVLNSVLLAQPAGQGNTFLSAPAQSQHVTWQGGGTLNCPGVTPTETSSWGQVKALYR